MDLAALSGAMPSEKAFRRIHDDGCAP